jgi:hypothetical protein
MTAQFSGLYGPKTGPVTPENPNTGPTTGPENLVLPTTVAPNTVHLFISAIPPGSRAAETGGRPKLNLIRSGHDHDQIS